MIVARTGWTTDELAAALDAHPPAPPFDLVTLLAGVNDQYRGRALANYRAEFRGLLERAIGYAGGRAGRVVVLSIPDWGMTPFASGRPNVSAEIDAFNAVNRAGAERAGARYLDVTPISRAVASAPSLLAPDGLHPSGAMYAQWADRLLPHAAQILSESTPQP